jgi:hypothetical protein
MRWYSCLAGYRSVFVVLERSSASKQLELLERLEPLEQSSLACVQTDGGPQSAGQTEKILSGDTDDSTGFEAS